MKVLVTGGAGFIGTWLTERLNELGHAVIVLDNLSSQIHGPIPRLALESAFSKANVEFRRGDIRDRDAMDAALADCDAVVHLAAETGTGQSMYRIGHYYAVNHQATAEMFEAIVARHRHINRVILASSRSVYGEGAYRLNGSLVVPESRDPAALQRGQFEVTGPAGQALELIGTPENAPPKPASVYAATKLANEALGQVIAKAYGLNVLALRFQNVYGELQSLKNPYTGILSIFSNRMREDRDINIFEDGLESRDFIHVSDVVRGITLALQSSLEGFHAINIGSGVPTSVLDVAQRLKAILRSQSRLSISGDFRAGDIRHCYADGRLARALIGFAPSVSLEQGLTAFCRWVETQSIADDQSAAAQRQLASAGLGKISE
jgi:dTDP-L-rhamnose 4-epimerase